MKKLLFIWIAIFCIVCTSYSQNDSLYGFYYANGTRHYWVEDHTSLNIIVNNLNHYDSIAARLGRIFNGVQDEILADNEDNNIIVNSNSLASRNISDIISMVSLSSNDIAFYTYAKKINGNPIWLTNETYVKLKNNTYYASHIQPILLQYPSVVSYYEGDNEYRFVCPTDSIVVTLANKLYDTACVVYSSPDYYCLGKLHTDDTFFNDQWNLKNTGQNGGVVGVDIKAEEAWTFIQKATGSSGGNIKVAVIDDGVEEHEDFYEGNGISVVLDGYTANNDGTGRPRPKNKHGECCAGIIAAVHNNIGLAGVAPHSRIVPIRIFRNVNPENFLLYMFPVRKVARAIEKSWTDFGASVLSCSWQLTEPNDIIKNAIIKASNEGRNGKGCIVVFSSGNEGVGLVGFPSILDQVLCVGSVDKNGHRVEYSNRGWELDLAAPDNVIITTDRMGDNGYCSNQTLEPNYYTAFSGTSAACPHVSGVAALMLSVNPNLTREQVFIILENTAQKVGGYNYNYNYPNGTWDQETGYGLVDAHMAVVESALYGSTVSIEGLSQLEQCEEYLYRFNLNYSDCFTYEWSISNNLVITDSSSNWCKIIPIGEGNAFVEVTAYSEGRPIRNYRKDLVIHNGELSSLVPLSNISFSITGNTTWSNNNHFLPLIVTVESGATLTVTGIVYCSQFSKIIVKPGGRLIINGGKLTNSCSGKVWQGIEVWGNSDTHQFEVNGSYGQGYLEMKNGAVIENAHCAVELWRPGYWSTTGGIVHASDATFRNNTVAVHALCYRNFNPGTNMEVVYNGHFDNCSFIINGGYIGTETFEKHVVLADVNGIVFQGCNFSADRSVSGVHQWCIGISAYDAGFGVKSFCSSSIKPCPMEDLDRSTFTGFCVGIRVDGDGNSPRSFTVNETVFTNNDYGIKTTNTNFPIIINNEFNIGRGEYCDHNYGIHLNNVTGFTIEENYFHPSSQSDATTVGIAITDCRGVNDVYHNTFESLSRANLAFGQNTLNVNNFTMPGAIQGLTYTCNDNIDNRRDFMVILKDGVAAIQPQQGSSAMPAGNTFRNSGFQFYNEGSQQIEYYYNSNETDETPDTLLLYRVNPHGTTNSNPCHSHYGNGPVVRSASEKTALESDYLSSYTTYLNIKQLYESSIDGGSTATQVANINNATPADMWQLRAQLLGLSPYVSGEVLTTAADRHDVFTDPVLFEILAANPDELKNDSLITYLESKTNPLPSYMIELLRQIASGATTRTALVAQMGKYSHDYTLAAGDIVRSNLNDTIANPAELRNWLGNMNDIAADRMAISSYLHEGDSASAFALANMLPELYGFQGDALADHGDYMRLLGLYQTLKSSQRTVYEMTEAEITTVGDIAETGTGVSKSMAESLMAEITGNDRAGCFAPDTPDPEGRGTGRGMNMGSSFNKAFGFSVSVAPNPATTWVTVDYTLPMKAAKATLTITNTIGTNVLSAELEGTQGSKVLDLRGLASGVYLYTIRCGHYVENGKIVIAK